MKKRSIPFSFLLAFLVTACAPSNDFTAFDRLVAAQQYESAWGALDALGTQDADVLHRRIHLCLDSYVQSLNHLAFALKDLGPGESLDSVRQAGGSFPLHSLDVPALVATWQKNHPRNALLDRDLGDFYSEVALRYSAYDQLDAEGIRTAALQSYGLAWKTGPFGGPSAESYSTLLLQASKWSEGLEVLDSLAASKEPGHPHLAYNRAFALAQTHQWALAQAEADRAAEGYAGNPDLQADALLLAYDAALNVPDLAKAEAVLARAQRQFPGELRLFRRRMALELGREAWAAAGQAADRYLASEPGNALKIRDVVGILEPVSAAETDRFLARNLELWSGEPTVAAGLLAVWGHTLLDRGLKAQARTKLDRAEATFRKAGALTAEASQYLSELRTRL